MALWWARHLDNSSGDLDVSANGASSDSSLRSARAGSEAFAAMDGALDMLTDKSCEALLSSREELSAAVQDAAHAPVAAAIEDANVSDVSSCLRAG